MKPRLIASALGVALSVIALPLSAFELEHAAGKLTLPETPKTIATYDLAVLDTRTALEIPVAGVPRSTYEGALAPHANTRVVGTLFEPDYPVLKEVKPDLIVAGGRSQAAMPELSKLAPTVSFTSDPRNFLETFRRANLALAKAFDKEAQAQAALNTIDGKLQKLHAANKGKTSAMLFTIKGNVIAHAPGDRFGYAYELTGTQSVLPATDPNTASAPRPEPNSPEAKAAAKKRAETITAIAKADPDWLIVLDRGAINNGEKTAEKTLAEHPELSQTRAFKEGRVHYVDPNGWYVIGGGLNNLHAITDQLLTSMQ